MAHTVTRQQAQHRLPAEPLIAWRGWLVHGRCLPGRAPGRQTVEALPDPPKPVGHLLQRLRCPQFGASPEGFAPRQNAQTQVWAAVRLPARLEKRHSEQPGLPGTVCVELWQR